MLIAYWIVAGLLALANLGAGGMKTLRPATRLAESGLAWAGDFPAWSVKAIGVVEVLGALGLVLPPLTGIVPVLAAWAAIGLGLIQLGAIVTHLVRGEAKTIPVNLVLLALSVAAAWLGFLAWA